MQLDIFEHSHDVMLRNDVIGALERHDAAAARPACERLAQASPGDAALPDLRALLQGLEARSAGPLVDHDALAQARQALEALQPVARRVFGEAAATTWLRPLWHGLAQRAEGLPFRADHAQDHAAALWLVAGQWQAAAQAVAGIESWRRIPAPLAWMSEARLRQLGLQAAWPLLAELGWLSPARLDRLLHQSPDPLLATLARRFGEQFDGDGTVDDTAWFAAWVLTERPEAAEHLSAAQAGLQHAPERAFRTLVELLGLERQGRQRDIVERRKALRDLHPSLYAAYMKAR